MWSQSEEFKGLLEKVSSKGTMDELVDMAIKDAPYVSPVSPQNSVLQASSELPALPDLQSASG